MLRERVESAVALAALRLPEALQLRVLGGRRIVVGGRTLDVPTQMLLRMMEISGFPAVNDLSVAEARSLYRARSRALMTPPPRMEKVVDRAIDGPQGRIPVRLYVPVGSPARAPVLVYYHGGGWVIGDLDTHDGPCRLLATRARCIVIAVDYRLAPEHKFPAAVDDCTAAYRWVREHAADLGGDPMRVAVGGDSAGANLAAVVAQWARDAGVSQPRYQMLVYPVTDARLSTCSMDVYGNGYLLTRELMEWFRDHYLNDETERLDPRASPLLARDLAGLAPAFVATAGFDPLCDEGRAYAERLREAGNEVTHRCYDGLIHGFFAMTASSPAALAAFGDAAAALRRVFGV